MLSQVISAILHGIESKRIVVEADISRGLPNFQIVGLPEGAVKEGKERVRAAIRNSGYEFPMKRITVNLAPADLKKEGSGLDLPIAIALLAATGLINGENEKIRNTLFVGELSLDGTLRPIRGVLPIAIGAKTLGLREIVVPYENAREAGVIDGIEARGAGHLSEVVEYLVAKRELYKPVVNLKDITEASEPYPVDFLDVIGNEHAIRALEIVAAGGHNCLLSGPPGSGKTMLAKRLPTIMSPMTIEEAIETTSIYSVAGQIKDDRILCSLRPFCSPHHTISDVAIIGGGQWPRPGQVSLAHNGVLFLDEMSEFSRSVLEALRQPIEDGVVTIARARLSVKYPANFILVGARNLCPCGNMGSKNRECTCSYSQIKRYNARISGPILDRIDIHIEVPYVDVSEINTKMRKSNNSAQSSKEIRERVKQARDIQTERFKGRDISVNAKMSPSDIKELCAISHDDEMFFESAVSKLGLSLRAYHKAIKVARTIADLDNSKTILRRHLTEALQYRTPNLT